MDFAAWLAGLGLDEATLSDVQKTNLRKKFDDEQAAAAEAAKQTETETDDTVSAETTPAPVDPAPAGATATAGAGGAKLTAARAVSPTVQRARDEMAAEEQRIAAIREIGETIGNPVVTEAGANGATLVAHAIQQGWDSGQTALYATRASRPRVPAAHSTSPAERGSIGALQAATMLRASRPIDRVLPAHHMVPYWQTLPVNHPDRQRVMDQSQEFRDVTMGEMAELALRASGHQVPSGRNRVAILQAAFSTGSVSALYEQTIGSMAIGSYVETGDFSAGWTSENDELNLEEHTRPRMASAPDLTLHPETGEADHVSRSATAETVKVDRYSRQFEIDEIAFINDNFQLLRNTPVEMGRAAARLRPTMVAAVLMANAALADTVALFHADHANLLTSSALAAATLKAARAKIAKQMDGDASINLPATHLIVPSDLGDLAIQLTGSAVISNDSGLGSTNPIRMRNILPVEEARLANGVVDPKTKQSIAGSGTTWYLVSAEGHTIEVQFLSGTGRVPVVVVTQLTGGKFGLNITVKHYVGAKALDYRAMLKATA